MPSALLTFCGTLLIGASLFAADEEIGAPSPDIPELAVLSHYAGTWDVTFSDGTTKAVAKARWILQGRFLEQTSAVQPADGGESFELKTLMTYDPDRKVYRSWTFMSTGQASEGEATWDAAKNTMTTKSQDAREGNTIITTAQFPDPDTEQWKIVGKDANGNILFELAGANRKRKN